MTDPEQEPLESSLSLPAEMTHSGDEPPQEFTLASEIIEAPSTQDRFPPWSGWHVVAVIGFTVAALFLFSSIALGIAHVFTRNQHVALKDLTSNTIVIIGSQSAAYSVAIFFMIALVRNESRQGFWRSIHWNWPRAAALAYLIAGALLAFVVAFTSRWLPIPKSVPMDQYFSELTGAYLMAVFGITLAPLMEELFFRGMLYPVVRRVSGVTVAVLFTATCFALIHGAQLGYAWAPLLSIFVVGVVFTLVRQRTDSVGSSFLMHCGYNLALFGSLWVASDHFRHLEKALN
jgi:membrane protease YdiL (CAAX protease family)